MLGTQAEAVILDADNGTHKIVDLGNRRADRILGLREVGNNVVIVERVIGAIRARRIDGTDVVADPLLTGALGNPAASLDVFVGDHHIMLRAIASNGDGEIVDLLSDDGATWSVRRNPFKAIGLRSAADGGPARFGIGQSTIGYLDAAAGGLLVPGDTCLRVGLRTRPTGEDDESLLQELPTLVPISTQTAVFGSLVFVGTEGVIQVKQEENGERVEDPPSDCRQQGYAF
jgi:hypothetical protein